MRKHIHRLDFFNPVFFRQQAQVAGLGRVVYSRFGCDPGRRALPSGPALRTEPLGQEAQGRG
ncbi:MAG TPA: hypothetical protein PLA61_02815, partial [Ferruginibacter sp.]|nr:hypothetical protein [Ferruginibacter sp.]